METSVSSVGDVGEGLEGLELSIIETIGALKIIDNLSDNEKSEKLKRANELLKEVMGVQVRACIKCKKVCINSSSCQFCIRKYLVDRLEKWTSENEQIDNLLEENQKNFTRIDAIIEWIPYSNLKDIRYMPEGNTYHKMKALWSEGRYTGWDFERQELKRFGPHTVTIKNISLNSTTYERSLQEIQVHLKLRSSMSPIVRVYGLTKDGNNDYMIITENVTWNLKSYIQENKSNLKWVQKYGILLSILDSLMSIHNNDLIHGDLHSGIIRYSVNREIWLIGDLNLCRPVGSPFGKPTERLAYVSPEILKESRVTTSSDVYSFGMIMYEVSTGLQPFNEIRPKSLLDEIIKGVKPQIMGEIPNHYRELMEKCWNYDPSERPTIAAIQDRIKDILSQSSPEEQNEIAFVKFAPVESGLESGLESTEPRPNQGLREIDIIKYDEIKNEEIFDGVGRISFAVMKSKKVAIKTIQIDKRSEEKIDEISEGRNDILKLIQQKVNNWGDIYIDKNVVEFLGIGIKDNNKLFLVMPFAEDGNLREFITKKKLSFSEKVNIAKNVASGIKALHDKNHTHGNINPNNVLVFNGIARISNLPLPFKDKKELKDIDYYASSDLFDNIGYIDPIYVLNKNKKKNTTADIYSLGTLLWELISERVPYQDDDGVLELIKRILKGQREKDIPNIDSAYQGLYKDCWQSDSTCRPTIQEVYEKLLQTSPPNN